MTTPALQPLPGTIGLTQISGGVGKLVRVGQWLCRAGFENYQHAFVVTDEIGVNGLPMIVEAEPGGARFVELHYSNVYWCDGIAHGLTTAERLEISQAACGFIGTGYSFLDYAAIAAKHLDLPVSAIDRYVASTHHVICSQLAAACYDRASVPIFSNTEWTGDVMPLDLYRRDVYLRAKYVMGA
jgi:hypothetical protein